MTTLRVVIDPILDPANRGIARYSEELTRALIAGAPAHCSVEGIVSASPEHEYNDLARRLPGLTGLFKSSLSRRELVRAWQYGFTSVPKGGMIHATSLLAPLRRHDRLSTVGQQTVVTVHDALAFTAPDTLSGRSASWHLHAIARAVKYADAVVVPTHAVAEALAEHTTLGDRIRVIGAAATTLAVPTDGDARAERLGLPAHYVATFASLNPRKALDQLLRAMSGIDSRLVIIGDPTWNSRTLESALADAGLDETAVIALGAIDDDDLAVVLDRAQLLAHPTLDEGFGMPVLDAFSLGTPVIMSDAPALLEVADGAALVVEREDADGYAERLASAIASVLADPETAADLSLSGVDRAGAFSWRSTAEKVWELHAEL